MRPLSRLISAVCLPLAVPGWAVAQTGGQNAGSSLAPARPEDPSGVTRRSRTNPFSGQAIPESRTPPPTESEIAGAMDRCHGLILMIQGDAGAHWSERKYKASSELVSPICDPLSRAAREDLDLLIGAARSGTIFAGAPIAASSDFLPEFALAPTPIRSAPGIDLAFLQNRDESMRTVDGAGIARLD